MYAPRRMTASQPAIEAADLVKRYPKARRWREIARLRQRTAGQPRLPGQRLDRVGRRGARGIARLAQRVQTLDRALQVGAAGAGFELTLGLRARHRAEQGEQAGAGQQRSAS